MPTAVAQTHEGVFVGGSMFLEAKFFGKRAKQLVIPSGHRLGEAIHDLVSQSNAALLFRLHLLRRGFRVDASGLQFQPCP
jgi:hypothetical protein